jgi:mono/diheme cytochrome c family protein
MHKIFVSLNCFVLLVGLAHADPQDERTTLSVEQAKVFAQDTSGRLQLDRLVMLSPEAAKELARFEGWLSLNGLTSLSKETAEALGQHKGPLHLNGLANVSDEAATALASHVGELSLNGLTSLSDEAAKALAKHNANYNGGRLYLNGLTTISTVAVQALATRKGVYPFRLEGLTSLSPETAAVLAQLPLTQWDPRLPSLETIPDDVAQALAKRELADRRPYAMGGLTSISAEAGKMLGPKLDGRLPALKVLSVDLAEGLAKKRYDGVVMSPLCLDGLTTLSPGAARAISEWDGQIYFDGLTEISDETLKALVEHKGRPGDKLLVHLRGLKTLSDDGAVILAAWPKWCGDLPALTALSEKSAAALASSRNWNGSLPSLKTITPDMARTLVGRQGNLLLDGLTTLSDETAKELARHQGGTLSLNGLPSLSDNAVVVLAARDGRLSLNGLKSLSDQSAAALGKHKGDWLFLDGLTSLTDEGARSLAQHAGIVSLKGLQTVSDASLQVLKVNSRIGLADKLRVAHEDISAKTDGKFVGAFLEAHCTSCHGGDSKEGDFSMDRLSVDNIAGRVAYASILERLRAGDMPPNVEDRPDPAESAGVVRWIASQLDTPLEGPVTPYAVKEAPVDGNRLPHAILFGGPRGPSVPPPPRLWRLSPSAYTKALSGFYVNGLQQPFGQIQDAGFKDFSAMYAPDEGAASLIIANAEQVVLTQTKSHVLANINEVPAGKEPLWPSDERIKTATPEEREHLAKGDRVRQGNGIFAPLMHPKVSANRSELVQALKQQYQAVVLRTPREEELKSLLELYEEVAREGDFSLAGKAILMAPLITPEAILRFEIGLGAEVRPGVRMLSPRETALAIGLSLSSRRNLGLLAAAAQGKLASRDEVAAAVRTALNDPKLGKSRILWFFREYFDYYRATDVFKDPLPDYMLRRRINHAPEDYVAETDLFVLQILGEDQDVFEKMLTAPAWSTADRLRSFSQAAREFPASTFQDSDISPIFRKLPPTESENDSRTAGDTRIAGDNIGVLMQPSWQVAWSTNFHNDIVRRGRWLRERLLGGRVPDLPINVAAMIPDDPHRTLRQRQMVTRAAECWECHYRMDELGTPFEYADHYGFVRTSEPVIDLVAMESVKDKTTKVYRDAPLDTTGFIRHSGEPSLDGPVKDAPEMLRRLAESERVRQVFIRHAFRFFLGRNETPGDAPALQEADRVYLASGGSFKELLVSLLSSESFLYRTLPAIAEESK